MKNKINLDGIIINSYCDEIILDGGFDGVTPTGAVKDGVIVDGGFCDGVIIHC